MKNKKMMRAVAGLVALGMIVASSFMPWFQWSFQEVTEVWTKGTSIWGPPAYIPGSPYASVDVPASDLKVVDGAVGVYLTLFLLGLVLWISLLWKLGRETERRGVIVAVGIGSVVIGIGLVVALGLAEVIAQRVGLYAAIRSSRIVVAELVGIRAEGPLMITVGIAIEAAARMTHGIHLAQED